jgi:hypothetical protein
VFEETISTENKLRVGASAKEFSQMSLAQAADGEIGGHIMSVV